MTDAPTQGSRLAAPPPGMAAPERLVARTRGSARRLTWSALVFIAVAGAVGWFFDNLPAPWENWMLFAAAGVVVLLLVLLPWMRWAARIYTITTRRVIVRSGVLARHAREYSHARGYSIALRRGPLQRIFRCGTLVLSNGLDEPLRLVNVPDPALLQEVLADQIEVSQILVHREVPATYGDMPVPARPPDPTG
ncbi:PH domain-containing protein [Microbacterium sp. LRZ72]|uniref:PH domain-containing protein n=1 Tax=Microbacterium sp. LRZ72 TaxID=2942481 RepID=UPI0029ADEF50|nr:PH domain-containing protein [Microbacterium sp. LRZ72]MDX2377004.1 PH domain-containing protein [Microbacterium sp. LRZ72]